MRIKKSYEVENICSEFNFWSGAKDRIEGIKAAKLEDYVDQIIEDVFCEEEEVDEMALNDFVWFELDDILYENGAMDKHGNYISPKDNEEVEDSNSDEDE